MLLLYLECTITFRNMLIFLNSPTPSLRSEQTELLPILWAYLIHVYLSKSAHFLLHTTNVLNISLIIATQFPKKPISYATISMGILATQWEIIFWFLNFLWGSNFVDKFCHIKNFDLLLPKCPLSPFFFDFQCLCNHFCFQLAPACMQVSTLFSISRKSIWQVNWWETKIFLQKIL